jgi:hypothetical protein
MSWKPSPCLSIMDVQAESWETLVERYEPAGYRVDMRAMHALVQAIAGAWWSRALYGHTSVFTLKVAQTRSFDIFGKQVLSIDPNPGPSDGGEQQGEIVFSYDGWTTSAPDDEAFAKLEHILRNRLKWIVDPRQPAFAE